jgi:signal transduction histidine kinase
MGLAIVKKSVSLMKGQINFTSQIDQGTMFNISLPVLSQDKKSHQV